MLYIIVEMLAELMLMLDMFVAISALLKSIRSTLNEMLSVFVLMLSVLVEIFAEFVLMLDI